VVQLAKAKKVTKKKIKAKAGKPAQVSWRQRLKRWLWRLLFVILIILLLPYLLVLLYRFEFIHPVSTLMLGELMSGRSYERQWVELEDVAPVMVQSVIMSEDGQYCAHSGVDWDALSIIVEETLENGSPSRGASTISMQVSKNLFLTSWRSPIRKMLEIPLALFSDMFWGKPRMIELYLNSAEWGHGIYGVEAAAQSYFGRSAEKLTRKQAALLTVALPNPILRNPANPSKGLRRLASRIETRSKQSGAYIKCIYP
jgi:monofunctional biosynthetic peptidoglycan transglycosylase